MEPNGPVSVHVITFVHSLSYIPIRVHWVPNYHLAGDPLELCQGPLGIPGPHFEKQCSAVLYVRSANRSEWAGGCSVLLSVSQ